jgi:serine protease Do
MTIFDELRDAAQRAAAAAAPAVVRVGRGAGVVIAPGRVLTNAHNVRGPEVGVLLPDGTRTTGAVTGVDVDGDLAVLTVDTGDATAPALGDTTAPALGDTTAPALGDTTAPALGDVVFAVTLTRAGVRVTTGTVSATGQRFRGPRGRLVTDALEHTAPMARGSSGSPLLDAEGRLVGISTHRRGDGFYLALPVTAELLARVERLAAGEAPTRPRLGIAVAPPHVRSRLREAVGLEDRPGLLVRGVGDDSPARRAEVRRGDLVVAAGGTPVSSSDELFAVLDALDPDATLELTVVRGTEELTLTVSFAADGDG